MRRFATITGLVLLSSTADLAPRAPAYGQPVATPAPVAQSERAEPDRSSAASTPTAPRQLPAPTAAEATAPTIPELLGGHLAVQLPAHVALAGFEVTALVNQGTPADPLYKARFQATAELRTPTFEEVGRIGPVTWLQLVRGPGERARLHGTATATRAANGPWQVEFALELNPLPRLGQPREAFPGVTVVRGSEEEKEFFGRLAAFARDRLALELPGHWRLGRFELGESALAGDRITLRFIADLSLLEPTYLETERIRETVLLTRVAEAGTERRLTGRAEFRPEGGRWLVDLQVDRPQGNAPDLGRPLGAFEGRVLVEGSAEEKAWREAQHQRQLEEVRRRQALEEEQRKAELAAAEHARRLEAERRASEAAERQARMAELARELRGQLALGLPGHWKVGEASLSELVEREDGSVAFAFAVPLELVEDTFLEKGRDGEVRLLARVAAAGERRNLAGKGAARREGQAWRLELRAEQAPLEGLGRPLGAFEGRVLVEGSAEEKAWREAQHQRLLEEVRHRQEVEEQRRQGELAEARHRTLLEQEQQKLELAKVQFTDRLEQERESREAARRQRQAERRQREIAALRAALESRDSTTRASALTRAVASNDPTLRQVALSQWLKTTNRVALQIKKADEDGQVTIVYGISMFALDFAAYDEANGTFTGRVVVPNIQNSPEQLAFSGNLSGEALSFAGPICQGTLRLAEGGFLKGELRCSGLRTARAWGTLGGVFRVAAPLPLR